MVQGSHRVLKWLQDASVPPSPAPVIPIESIQQPAAAAAQAAAAPEQPTAPLTARQRVAQLWRSWKAKALRKPEGKPSLSPAVLKQHQQLCELQGASSVGLHTGPDAGFNAACALTASAALPWAASSTRHDSAAAAAAAAPQDATYCSAVQSGRVAAAYDSAFYQPSANMQLPKGPASPQTPKPGEAGAASQPPPLLHRSAAAVNSPLPSASSCSTAAASPRADTSSPSMTPRGVSALRCSSSFNQTHTGSADPSQHGALTAAWGGSRDWDAPVQHSGGSGSGGGAAPSSGGWPSPQRQLQALPSPLQHSQDVFSGAHNAQLQQLLQAPKQQSPVQQLRPASSVGPLLPAGTALTAYPAVAAAFSNAAAAGWLQHGTAATSILQHSSSGAARQAAGEPSSAASAFESPFAQAAGQGCAVPGPQQPAAPTAAAGPASTTPAEVQEWLLRAAVVEDELQGRAMEVAEELPLLQERREALASLAAALQQSPAGSAAHEAAVQSAVSSLGAGRGCQYRAGCVADGGRPRTPGIRSQLGAELSRLDSRLSQLQSRASSLGSALAALQGVQAVLGSSRAAGLRPCSRLAVLQLVLSDVVARLPAERLQELPVLEGLPALDTEAREICRLAEAGSLHAAVQPLLHSGTYPPATPQPSAGLPAGGLHRQGTGTSASITSASTVTATASHSMRPPHSSHAYGSGSAAGAPYSSTHQHQQQQPWYEGLKPEGAGSDDEDDDILDSLSSVLSSRHYTPRPSLSYESRKAAAAAEARRHAAALAQRPASAIAPPGSAAAAGAAALTLAGIAGSGSWSQWPAEDSSCDAGIGSSSHAGLWDMVSLHHPPSQHSGAGRQLLPPQPSSPSSAASSRRALSRASGFNAIGPLGLPYPLHSWPESPRAAGAAVPGLMRSPDPPPTPASLLPLHPAAAAGGDHSSAGIALGHLRQAYGRMAGTAAAPQLPDQTMDPGVQQLAAQEAPSSTMQSTQVPNPSRASSFESCKSARSRFSMEVPAGDCSTAPVPAAPRATSGSSNTITCDGRPPAVVQALPVTAAAGPGPAGAGMLNIGTGTAAARGMPGAAALVNSPVAAALPAGVDLHKMTVGELLQVLSSAVSLSVCASHGQHP